MLFKLYAITENGKRVDSGIIEASDAKEAKRMGFGAALPRGEHWALMPLDGSREPSGDMIHQGAAK